MSQVKRGIFCSMDNDRDYVNQSLQDYGHGRETYFHTYKHSKGIVPSIISALDGVTDLPHTPATLLFPGGTHSRRSFAPAPLWCPLVRQQGSSDVIISTDGLVRFTNPSDTSKPHILTSGVRTCQDRVKGHQQKSITELNITTSVWIGGSSAIVSHDNAHYNGWIAILSCTRTEHRHNLTRSFEPTCLIRTQKRNILTSCTPPSCC